MNEIMLYSEASQCLLCQDPSCSAACDKGVDCGRILRALNFRNLEGAARLYGADSCAACSSPAPGQLWTVR